MIKSITANAKVNLFLDVLNKRNDGYHNIGTLFQAIDFGDELVAHRLNTPEILIQSNIQVSDKPEQDLIYRAAKAIQEYYQIEQGVRFLVNKRLPMGAGLGGGSSDAAAAIKLCTELWDIPWNLNELIPLATKLGADVPFFLEGGTALAEGIGEELAWIPFFEELKDKFVVILTPQSFVPTSVAYSHLKPSGDERWENFKQNLLLETDISSLAYNKFEEYVLPQYPDIQTLKHDLLQAGANFALLSGSGASVFAVFNQKEMAERALALFNPQCRFGICTTFIQEAGLNTRTENL